MDKLQKVLVTPEVLEPFRKVLKELTLFNESELIMTSEWIGKHFSDDELFKLCELQSPNLLITSNKILAVEITKKCQTVKVLILGDKENNLGKQLMVNIFHVRAFLSSRSSILAL